MDSSQRAYEDWPDEELILWSARGDTRAFDAIVARHGAFALRVARRLISDHSLAQDVVQEAMIRAWTRSKHFNAERARLTTWLYRIVVNLCIDYRRRARSEPTAIGFDPIDPTAQVSEEIEAAELRLALEQALHELPGRQRAAMMLVYGEGLSGAEAAQVLGVSAKAVERLLARARAVIRERLADPAEGRTGSR
jgi:RNA polymerase sigma-70 factor, ECF subfamily